MNLYFEFLDQRRRAVVSWPKNDEPIIVRLLDKDLLNKYPEDLYFEIERKNQVSFTPEDSSNKNLTELQQVLARRLQEFANQR